MKRIVQTTAYLESASIKRVVCVCIKETCYHLLSLDTCCKPRGTANVNSHWDNNNKSYLIPYDLIIFSQYDVLTDFSYSVAVRKLFSININSRFVDGVRWLVFAVIALKRYVYWCNFTCNLLKIRNYKNKMVKIFSFGKCLLV